MRIVAVADTHTYHHDLAVPEGDVFVHAGDLCRRGAGILDGAEKKVETLLAAGAGGTASTAPFEMPEE